MKDINHFNNILLFFFLLLTTINNTNQNEVKIIPDASLNATATYISLDIVDETDFLYFSFDFDFHNQVNQKQKNIADFKISTELELSSSDIEFAIVNKKQEEINSTMLDIDNNILWRSCYFLNKVNNGNISNYYTEITNKFNNYNINTLVLRIPFLENEGEIIIENLLSLPDEMKFRKKKNEIIYYHGGRNNIRRNHTHKNYIHFYNNYTHFQRSHSHSNKNHRHSHIKFNQYSHWVNNHINNKKYNINLNSEDQNSNLYNNYKNDKKNKNKYNNGYNQYDINYNYPKKFNFLCKYLGCNIDYIILFHIISTIVGIILAHIWVIILILYFIVHQKKSNAQLVRTTENMQH